MCASCWDRYYDRFVGLSRETPNYFLGVLMGLLMSLVTGMVWALSLIIVENIERNFFEPQYLIYYVIPSSIFMGTYMARRVMWGLKRKDVRAYIISGAFSVLSGVNGILAASLWRTYFDFKIQDKWRYLYGFQRYGLERFFLTYGEVLATGVFICATMLFALTETRELLLSYRLVRVRAPEKRAAKWEYIEDRSVRIR